ncbi:MAG: phospholipase D-like domain-containing protein, partial [Elusimicrobiota bacterium]
PSDTQGNNDLDELGNVRRQHPSEGGRGYDDASHSGQDAPYFMATATSASRKGKKQPPVKGDEPGNTNAPSDTQGNNDLDELGNVRRQHPSEGGRGYDDASHSGTGSSGYFFTKLNNLLDKAAETLFGNVTARIPATANGATAGILRMNESDDGSEKIEPLAARRTRSTKNQPDSEATAEPISVARTAQDVSNDAAPIKVISGINIWEELRHYIQSEIALAKSGQPSGIRIATYVFTDKSFKQWLEKALTAGVPVELIINRTGPKTNFLAAEELESKGAKVLLRGGAGKIMHLKYYEFVGQNVVMQGSANASEAAFRANDESLTRFDPAKADAAEQQPILEAIEMHKKLYEKVRSNNKEDDADAPVAPEQAPDQNTQRQETKMPTTRPALDKGPAEFSVGFWQSREGTFFGMKINLPIVKRFFTSLFTNNKPTQDSAAATTQSPRAPPLGRRIAKTAIWLTASAVPSLIYIITLGTELRALPAIITTTATGFILLLAAWERRNSTKPSDPKNDAAQKTLLFWPLTSLALTFITKAGLSYSHLDAAAASLPVYIAGSLFTLWSLFDLSIGATLRLLQFGNAHRDIAGIANEHLDSIAQDIDADLLLKIRFMDPAKASSFVLGNATAQRIEINPAVSLLPQSFNLRDRVLKALISHEAYHMKRLATEKSGLTLHGRVFKVAARFLDEFAANFLEIVSLWSNKVILIGSTANQTLLSSDPPVATSPEETTRPPDAERASAPRHTAPESIRERSESQAHAQSSVYENQVIDELIARDALADNEGEFVHVRLDSGKVLLVKSRQWQQYIDDFAHDLQYGKADTLIASIFLPLIEAKERAASTMSNLLTYLLNDSKVTATAPGSLEALKVLQRLKTNMSYGAMPPGVLAYYNPENLDVVVSLRLMDAAIEYQAMLAIHELQHAYDHFMERPYSRDSEGRAFASETIYTEKLNVAELPAGKPIDAGLRRMTLQLLKLLKKFDFRKDKKLFPLFREEATSPYGDSKGPYMSGLRPASMYIQDFDLTLAAKQKEIESIAAKIQKQKAILSKMTDDEIAADLRESESQQTALIRETIQLKAARAKVASEVAHGHELYRGRINALQIAHKFQINDPEIASLLGSVKAKMTDPNISVTQRAKSRLLSTMLTAGHAGNAAALAALAQSPGLSDERKADIKAHINRLMRDEQRFKGFLGSLANEGFLNDFPGFRRLLWQAAQEQELYRQESAKMTPQGPARVVRIPTYGVRARLLKHWRQDPAIEKHISETVAKAISGKLKDEDKNYLELLLNTVYDHPLIMRLQMRHIRAAVAEAETQIEVLNLAKEQTKALDGKKMLALEATRAKALVQVSNILPSPDLRNEERDILYEGFIKALESPVFVEAIMSAEELPDSMRNFSSSPKVRSKLWELLKTLDIPQQAPVLRLIKVEQEEDVDKINMDYLRQTLGARDDPAVLFFTLRILSDAQSKAQNYTLVHRYATNARTPQALRNLLARDVLSNYLDDAGVLDYYLKNISDRRNDTAQREMLTSALIKNIHSNDPRL